MWAAFSGIYSRRFFLRAALGMRGRRASIPIGVMFVAFAFAFSVIFWPEVSLVAKLTFFSTGIGCGVGIGQFAAPAERFNLLWLLRLILRTANIPRQILFGGRSKYQNCVRNFLAFTIFH
jgi:hypothetical protein